MERRLPVTAFALRLTVPPPGSRRVRRSLYEQIRAAILNGRLAAGVQLPASRALAAELQVSRNVIAAIYDLLVTEGYAVSRVGAGTFVAEMAKVKKNTQPRQSNPRTDWLNPLWRNKEPAKAIWPDNPLYDLRAGIPDTAHFPFDLWKRLYNRAFRKLSRTPGFGAEAGGLAALREAIALHISSTRAVACSSDAIVITAGAQQAFDLIARVLISKKRAVVAVENPGYPPCRTAFSQAGGEIVPVAVDKEGLRPDLLPRETAIVCATPSHQFPTGVAMSAGRRQALLDVARQIGAVIVEDDYDGEFGFSERPQEALQTLDQDERVFYVGTFSKSIFPALRLGFIVAPNWARNALIAARQASDWHSPVVNQAVLAEFISEGHLRRHVRRMRTLYVERRKALLEAVERHCGAWLEPMPGAAGLHLALAPRRTWNIEKAVMRAAERGIAINSLATFSIGADPMKGFAVGYGQIATSRVDSAIFELSKALKL